MFAPAASGGSRGLVRANREDNGFRLPAASNDPRGAEVQSGNSGVLTPPGIRRFPPAIGSLSVCA